MDCVYQGLSVGSLIALSAASIVSFAFLLRIVRDEQLLFTCCRGLLPIITVALGWWCGTVFLVADDISFFIFVYLFFCVPLF